LPLIERTAYPRFSPVITASELQQSFTPTDAEQEFAQANTPTGLHAVLFSGFAEVLPATSLFSIAERNSHRHRGSSTHILATSPGCTAGIRERTEYLSPLLHDSRLLGLQNFLRETGPPYGSAGSLQSCPGNEPASGLDPRGHRGADPKPLRACRILDPESHRTASPCRRTTPAGAASLQPPDGCANSAAGWPAGGGVRATTNRVPQAQETAAAPVTATPGRSPGPFGLVELFRRCGWPAGRNGANEDSQLRLPGEGDGRQRTEGLHSGQSIHSTARSRPPHASDDQGRYGRDASETNGDDSPAS